LPTKSRIDEKTGDSGIFLVSFVAVLLVLQFAATLTLPRGTALATVTDTIQLVLACLATFVFLRNSSRSRGTLRVFWGLFITSWATLSFSQAAWFYYEVFRRRSPPGLFMGDVLLFLGTTPILAALLLQIDPQWWKRRQKTGFVGFALLLVWWFYLYLYFVAPWQFVEIDEARYNAYYNPLDALGDVAVLVLAAYLFKRASSDWRKFYGVFFTAQLVLSGSSYIANMAIDRRAYFSGSWYDIPFTSALGLFTVVGLVGGSLMNDMSEVRVGSSFPLSTWGMFSLLSLPVIAAMADFTQKVSMPVRRFRELVVQGAVLVMGVLIFMHQRRLIHELAGAARVLKHASVTDSLTGCRNRRFLDAVLPVDASQALRSSQTAPDGRAHDLVFYVIDLDNFKDVNDRYGHAMGDRVLVAIANRMKSEIRKSDILVRWGGDEFMIVSRNCDRTEASGFCRRILDVVDVPIAIESAGSPTMRQTCSIGWAAYPWRPNRPEELECEAVLALADRALYQAKISGKNQGVGIMPSGSKGAIFEMTASAENESHPTQEKQPQHEIDLGTLGTFSVAE
jgi:diguanylate cyclase (GGDEF)-like protein